MRRSRSLVGFLLLVSSLATAAPSRCDPALPRRVDTRPLAPEVEAILDVDPRLLDAGRTRQLLEQRQAALARTEAQPHPSPRLVGDLLREIGALQWALAEVRETSPDGGTRETLESIRNLRLAVEALISGGEGSAQSLLDAQLRLAEVLALGWCDGGPDCDARMIDASSLADAALEKARATKDPGGIARALRLESELRRAAGARAGEAVGQEVGLSSLTAMGNCYENLGRQCLTKVGEQPDQNAPYERMAAWQVAMAGCMGEQMNTCATAGAPAAQAAVEHQAARGDDRQDRIRLLDEALRLEAAPPWSRGRVETLLRLARLYLGDHQRERALALLVEAAKGCNALDLAGNSRAVGAITEMYLLAAGAAEALPRDALIVGQRAAGLLETRSTGSDELDVVLLARVWETAGEAGLAEKLAARLLAQGRPEAAARVAEQALALAAPTPAEARRLRQLAEAALERRGRDGDRVRPQAGPSGPLAQPTESSRTDSPLASCDGEQLRRALEERLAAERGEVISGLRRLSESGPSGVTLDLDSEDEVLRPILRCASHEPKVLKISVERLLLRRQPRRYHSELLRRARQSKSAKAMALVEKLVAWRGLLAQLRLRTLSELRQELRDHPLPLRFDWPRWADPVDVTVIDLEHAIREAERELASLVDTEIAADDVAGIWARLLEGLGDDGALVSYVPVATDAKKNRLLALVASGDGRIDWRDLGDETGIAATLTSPVAEAGLDDETLRRAGRALFDPLEGTVGGKRRILLLASGFVRSLPWSSLRDSGGRYLGERFAVTRLALVGDAAPLLAINTGGVEVVLVAPSYPLPTGDRQPADWRLVPATFPPLDGARVEIAKLSVTLGGAGTKLREIVGGAATEAAVRGLASPTVLHIAAHGFRRPDLLSSEWLGSPWYREAVSEASLLRVGMAVHGSNEHRHLTEDDGLLTASEVADLDLGGTKLVVLSGCDTGRATLQDSADANDLALGFRMAGARSVVASLWRVDDRATAKLMDGLYRSLRQGMPLTEALWQAKRGLRNDPAFADPRFWAAFEVFGSDVTLWARPVAVAGEHR